MKALAVTIASASPIAKPSPDPIEGISGPTIKERREKMRILREGSKSNKSSKTKSSKTKSAKSSWHGSKPAGWEGTPVDVLLFTGLKSNKLSKSLEGKSSKSKSAKGSWYGSKSLGSADISLFTGLPAPVVEDSSSPRMPSQTIPGHASPATGTPTTVPTQSPTAATESPSGKAVPSALVTHAPSASSSPTAREAGRAEGPYSGLLLAKFKYEIYNTLGADAQSIRTGDNPENSVMGGLSASTANFVEGVIEDAFGAIHSDRSNAGLATTRGMRGGRRGRGLMVLLATENPLRIDGVEDISSCSDASLAGIACQRVTAAANLVLANEARNLTEQRFREALSRSLADPGVHFEENTGIVYAGAATDSKSPAVIKASKPGDLLLQVVRQEEQRIDGTPAWAIGLSVGAAAVLSLAFLFAALRSVKRSSRNKEDFDELEDSVLGMQIVSDETKGCNDEDPSGSGTRDSGHEKRHTGQVAVRTEDVSPAEAIEKDFAGWVGWVWRSDKSLASLARSR